MTLPRSTCVARLIQTIYEKAFAPYKPARSAVEVARLPKDVLVEIECIAAEKK